ncbi:MAG: hypothetical protein ABFQ65_00960 [Nanoarchaeota archaeon]
MNNCEPSNKTYLIDMGEVYGHTHRQEILEKFGRIGIPDYNGKYRKSLENISEQPEAYSEQIIKDWKEICNTYKDLIASSHCSSDRKNMDKLLGISKKVYKQIKDFKKDEQSHLVQYWKATALSNKNRNSLLEKEIGSLALKASRDMEAIVLQ